MPTILSTSEALGTDSPLSAPPFWNDPPGEDHPGVARALRNLKAMPITKGAGAAKGETLGDHWLTWQDKLTRCLFGLEKEDGTRRIETVYVEMPKKSGKSHYAAGLGLYMLGGQEEFGAEVYSAGYNQDQAKVTWGIALDMLRLSSPLARRFEEKEYRNQILFPTTNGVWEPLTKQDLGQHGFNPFCVLFDELHTQQSRAMWDAIKRSMGGREEPLLFAITNAGHDRQSLCFHMREYAMAVNRGDIDDPSFLGLIFGADPEEDDWTEPEVWRRANPGLGVTAREDRVGQECEEAKVQPSAVNSFKRWHLSIWTRQVTRWLPDELINAAAEGWEPYEGAVCYGGLDLGAVNDLTAWVKAFPDPNEPELVRFVCDVWCAEAQLWNRKNPYRDSYQAWAEAGWLNVVPGDVVDYEDVKKKILDDSETFNLVDLAVDNAFQGHQLMIELQEHSLTVAAMRTTYNHMTSPCNELERRMRMDPPKARPTDNPVLKWALANTALKEPDPDRKRPVKDSQDAKIDPVVALLFSLDRAMRHQHRESVYESRGPLVFG